MHPDLSKLLELKKINEALAAKLDTVSPGSYCKHSSWGTGKITSWSLKDKAVAIDFELKKDHRMSLEMALKALTPLPQNHFYAQRYERLDELVKLAESAPLDLLELVILGHGGQLNLDDLETALKGSVVPEAKFKTWWDKTRTAARAGTRFIIPLNKKDPLEVRSGEFSKMEAHLADYQAKKSLKHRVALVEKILSEDVNKEPEAAQKLFALIETDLLNGTKLDLQELLELAVERDNLLEKTSADLLPSSIRSLATVMTDFEEGKLLFSALSSIPVKRQKRIYRSLPEAFGTSWINQALTLFEKSGEKSTPELAKYLAESPEAPTFLAYLKRGIDTHGLPADALLWICKEHDGLASPLFSFTLAPALVSCLERDPSESKDSGSGRLKRYLMSKADGGIDLMIKLINLLELNDALRFFKSLLDSHAFSASEKTSRLFIDLTDARPELHQVVLDRLPQERAETLVVSWASLRKKKEELEDIINVRIPQNIKDIALARSYGDLSENFEYKSAKQQQGYLTHRRNQLEKEITIARGSDFSKTDDSAVNIGTTVSLTDRSGNTIVYHILGAWDSDPEQHIVSYKSAIGQKLLGLKPGDKIDLSLDDDDTTKDVTVTSITRCQINLD